jgi:hypothetical protein
MRALEPVGRARLDFEVEPLGIDLVTDAAGHVVEPDAHPGDEPELLGERGTGIASGHIGLLFCAA